jgi:hypothetical protein
MMSLESALWFTFLLHAVFLNDAARLMPGETQFKLYNLFLAPLTTLNNFQLFLLWFLLRYLETNILFTYQLSSQLPKSNGSPGGRNYGRELLS